MALLHLADSRRAVGRYYIGELREDGTGYGGQVEQYPVICALDIVEQPVTMRSRREHVVTDNPRAVGCHDCRARIGR